MPSIYDKVNSMTFSKISKELAIPTRQQVRDGLAVRIWADLKRVNTVIGPSALHTLLGLAPSIETPDTLLPPLELAHFDIDRFELGRLTMALYDFAFDGVFPYSLSRQEFWAAFEHYEDFVVSLSSDVFITYLQDLQWAIQTDVFGPLETLYKAAYARFQLEVAPDMNGTPGYLSLEDIALLGNVQLVSVRNALSAQGDERLNAMEHDREKVDAPEAKRWLMGRRHFKPTVFPVMSSMEDDHPDHLNSLYELGAYMNQRWSALEKTDMSALLQELEWPVSRLDYLVCLCVSPHTLDMRDCPALAASLQVSESWFTAEAMRLIYPRQYENLKNLMALPEPAMSQPLSAKKRERLSQRLVFEMRDGDQMFPVRMKNRETGEVNFRLSEGGTGGNTKEKSIEIESEDEMIRMVVQEKMAVRLNNRTGTRFGLYRPDGHAVHRILLDGEEV